ncbi:MAG: HAD family hydrolase [Clostridia bacterium]|nr:HAD family hydrolase [Clostridia bacterium]
MRYTDIIFDLYGTLVDINTEEDNLTFEKTALFYNFYAANYTADELKTSYLELIEKTEKSSTTTYECYPEVKIEKIFSKLFIKKGILDNCDQLGLYAAQLFRITSINYLKLYPGVVEALKFLKKIGCRLWLLSNAQAVFTKYELQALGISKYFNGIYLSSNYGHKKPDSRFFDALIKEHNLDCNKCIMIGNDRNSDILGANNMKIDSLYMHSNLSPSEDAPPDFDKYKLGLSKFSLNNNSKNYTISDDRPSATYGYYGYDWRELLPLLVDIIYDENMTLNLER